jgi:hypothetical protein
LADLVAGAVPAVAVAVAAADEALEAEMVVAEEGEAEMVVEEGEAEMVVEEGEAGVAEMVAEEAAAVV